MVRYVRAVRVTLGLVWFGMLRQGGARRSWFGGVRFGMVGSARRSRLGLVVRGEEWQGGRGLERLVTFRLGELWLGGLGQARQGYVWFGPLRRS